MDSRQAQQLDTVHTQLVTGPDPARWGWPVFPGGSRRPDGTPDHLTPVDYHRVQNVRAEDTLRSLAELHRKLDALTARLDRAPVATAAGGLTADAVRAVLRESLDDVGPLYLTATNPQT